MERWPVTGRGGWARLRLLAALLAAFVALTACRGGQQAAPGGESSPRDQAGAEVARDARAAGECGRVEGETRLVEHAMGTTPVPLKPERVVVLDTGELDSALSLGVTPVGAVAVSERDPFPSYLLDRTEGIRTVGTIAQPSLEAIAALRPDLILSSKLRHERIYDQLSQIAPTVFSESVGVVWKENLRLNALALGRCAEAEEQLAGYEQRLAAFRAAMGERLGRTTVSVIRSLPNQVRIQMHASFIGTVLKDAGLPRPPAQDKNVFMEEATLERIPDLDADVMFVTKFGDDDARLDQLKASPAWAALGVVQRDRVFEVPDGRWMLGIGIIAANEVIDDLFGYLAQ